MFSSFRGGRASFACIVLMLLQFDEGCCGVACVERLRLNYFTLAMMFSAMMRDVPDLFDRWGSMPTCPLYHTSSFISWFLDRVRCVSMSIRALACVDSLSVCISLSCIVKILQRGAAKVYGA